MRRKNPGFLLFLLALLVLPAFYSFGQESDRYFNNGTRLYNMSRWHDAAAEFRRAQETAVYLDEWSRALYWVILSELAHSDYGSAIRDMEDLQRHASNSTYARDMVYHRARVYFNQGFFEDALVLFNHFKSSISDTDRESSDRIAASFFWMGECLYSMGQYDEAEKFYAWVVSRYPESPKVEEASYRLELIVQKKIEAELLALLQWSHEEALRTSEEYQRKIRTYENTLNIFQRRIAELSTGSENRGNLPALPEIPYFSESVPSQPVLFEPPAVYQTPVPKEEPVISLDFIRTLENSRAGGSGSPLVERAIELEGDVQYMLRENEAGRNR